jgi:hypothetical protein
MKQHRTPTPLITATVCAGDAETRYTRGGTGDPVVILAGEPRTRAALIAALARDLRVIAPELPVPAAADGRGQLHAADGDASAAPGDEGAAEGSGVCRLCGVLDGLGLDRVALVADELFAACAIAFALLEPERTAAVVLTLPHSPDSAPADGIIEGRLRLGEDRNDLLVAWLDREPGDERAESILARVAGFIATR